jgi:hypothetical protein
MENISIKELNANNVLDHLKLLKSNIFSGLNYKSVLEELLYIYENMERSESKRFNSISAIVFLILLCMSGKYEEANRKREIFKVLKILF